MKKVGLKFWLGGGVSALTLAAMTAVACAQDAPPAATSDATVKSDATATDSDSTVVVVTARRKALQSAIQIKKNSDTIVDSIVADEAGQLPDSSITEVLQRVSGITMSRYSVGRGGATPNFQIEGTGISVRGLPYNSSTLNGRQAFSANGASSLSWGDVTPELMGGVDVYKASRADLIEGGTSSIDLRTHMPFDYKKPEFDFSFGASYGDAAKKTSPTLSALYTRRFDTKYGEMGFLVDVAHSVYDSQDSDAQIGRYTMENDPNVASGQALVPTGYSWSQSKHTRTRDGLYAAFQWKPNDELTLSSTFFYSQNKNRDQSHSGGWGFDPNSSTENIPENATFDSHGAMQSGNLYVGATGGSTPIFGWGGNNWLAQYWDPTDPNYSYISNLSNHATILNADCRSQYGDAHTQSPNINWGNWDSPGMFYCQQNNAVGLNLGGSTSYGKGISSTMDISQSFDWRPSDSLRVRGALQFVDSISNSRSMYAGITQSDANLTSANFDATKSIPTLGGFDATALANTDTAYFNSFNYNGNDNRGNMLAANLDVNYDLGDDHFFKSVSGGVRATNRKERDDFVGTYWAPISEGWVPYYAYLTGPNSHGTVSSSDYELYNFSGYFGGKTQSPGTVLAPSMSMMQTLDWAHLASMSVDVAQGGKTTDQYYKDSIDQGTGITNTNIQNRAAYVEAKFGSNGFGFIPAFTGNIGVRVVNEVLRGQGNLSIDGGGKSFYLDIASLSSALSGNPEPTYQVVTSASPRYKKYGYTRVLPSFNVKFDLPSDLVLRMAASESMSPPNLGDIRPGGHITATTQSVLVGNPDGSTSTLYYLLNMYSQSGTGSNMKPVMIDSADLSLEWYPKDGVYSYIDFFHKELTDQDMFQDYNQTQATPLLQGTGMDPVTLDLPWYYVQNKSVAKAAEISGFELGGRTFLDSLPGPFKGFGLNGSVTYVDSRNPAALANSVVGPFALPGNTNGVAANSNTDFGKMPYFGMSKWSYNVELLYSRGPFNARLAYNWHSKQLLSTSSNPLSYIGRGSGGGEMCTACLSDPVTHGHVWDMVPQWSDDAGYLDFSFDYKINDNASLGIQANNLTNTLSKTLQEPLPGVFERLDTYQADRRVNFYLRMHY